MSSPKAAAQLRDGAYFANETFADLDLHGIDLGGKEFYRCAFLNCQLGESRWTESALESCVFRGCDLSSARFRSTGLRGVRFENSKLMGIDWSGISSNPELAFEDCKLRYSQFGGLALRGTAFLRCSVVEVNFVDVDLTEADFTGSDLAGSSFQGCTLARTDFRGATGLFLDPARNRIQRTGIPLETAVLLAQSAGMVVAGHGDESLAPAAKKRR